MGIDEILFLIIDYLDYESMINLDKAIKILPFIWNLKLSKMRLMNGGKRLYEVIMKESVGISEYKLGCLKDKSYNVDLYTRIFLFNDFEVVFINFEGIFRNNLSIDFEELVEIVKIKKRKRIMLDFRYGHKNINELHEVDDFFNFYKLKEEYMKNFNKLKKSILPFYYDKKELEDCVKDGMVKCGGCIRLTKFTSFFIFCFNSKCALVMNQYNNFHVIFYSSINEILICNRLNVIRSLLYNN